VYVVGQRGCAYVIWCDVGGVAGVAGSIPSE
jgi:hypothetical protein